jgi:hypothetical protein
MAITCVDDKHIFTENIHAYYSVCVCALQTGCYQSYSISWAKCLHQHSYLVVCHQTSYGFNNRWMLNDLTKKQQFFFWFVSTCFLFLINIIDMLTRRQCLRLYMNTKMIFSLQSFFVSTFPYCGILISGSCQNKSTTIWWITICS